MGSGDKIPWGRPSLYDSNPIDPDVASKEPQTYNGPPHILHTGFAAAFRGSTHMTSTRR